LNDIRLRVLLIEDNEDDVLLIRRLLAGTRSIFFDLVHKDRLNAGIAALKEQEVDIVLLDLGLPDCRVSETFDKFHTAYPHLPVIILTGLDDEELAVKKMQEGAQDYLTKGQIDTNILVRAIRHAIERQKLKTQLEMSLKEVKTLSGLLPICASCKKIRDDKGYWNLIEVYISEHTNADFSHGICPECAKKIYPNQYKKVWADEDK